MSDEGFQVLRSRQGRKKKRKQVKGKEKSRRFDFYFNVIVVSLRLSFNLFVDVKMKVPVIVAATAEIYPLHLTVGHRTDNLLVLGRTLCCSTTEPVESSVQSEDVRF